MNECFTSLKSWDQGRLKGCTNLHCSLFAVPGWVHATFPTALIPPLRCLSSCFNIHRDGGCLCSWLLLQSTLLFLLSVSYQKNRAPFQLLTLPRYLLLYPGCRLQDKFFSNGLPTTNMSRHASSLSPSHSPLSVDMEISGLSKGNHWHHHVH